MRLLIHRYRSASVHYVQAQKMKNHGIFSDVRSEVGHIIVAEVSKERIAKLLEADRASLSRLIDKTGPPPR